MTQARTAGPLSFLRRSAQPVLAGPTFQCHALSLVDTLLLCALLASIPVAGLSMRYAMSILIVIKGPMQLLRTIPYDIRLFIAMSGRTYFTLLQLVSFSRDRLAAIKKH
jgi:hypothetical protein